VTSTTGVFSLSISAGQFLNTGNFTLTICPRLAANDTTTNPPPVRQCGVLFLEVRNSPMSNFDNYVMYVSLATVAVAASAVVSLLYMKRWRSA
jgi:predicted exporter